MLRSYIVQTECEKLESYKSYHDKTILDEAVQELLDQLPDAIKWSARDYPSYLTFASVYIKVANIKVYSNIKIPHTTHRDIQLKDVEVVKHYSAAYNYLSAYKQSLRKELSNLSDYEVREKYPLAMLDSVVVNKAKGCSGAYQSKVYFKDKLSNVTIPTSDGADIDIRDFSFYLYKLLSKYYA